MDTRVIRLIGLAVVVAGAMVLGRPGMASGASIRDCDCWEAQGAWLEMELFCSAYQEYHMQNYWDWWCPNVTSCWVNESTSTIYWTAQCDYYESHSGNPCQSYLIPECQ